MLSAISRDSDWQKVDQLIRLQSIDTCIQVDLESLISWWTSEIHDYHDCKYFQTWLIEYQGQVAGIVDIQWVDLTASEPELLEVPEIGYWVAKEFRGRGFATFAVKSLVELYGYPSYQARVYKDNYASQRVLDKCQFSSIYYNECTEHYLYQWNQVN